MTELLYGIVNARGELIGVTSDEGDAVKDAKRIAKGRPIASVTSDEEDDPARDNPPVRGNEPAGALRGMLIKPVSMRNVMEYSVAEAHQALRDTWDDAPKSWRKAGYVANSLAGKNAKLAKGAKAVLSRNGIRVRQDIETYGLSLAPNTIAWTTPVAPAQLIEIADEITGKTRRKLPNLCQFASPECIAGCLVATGQSGMGGYDYQGKRVAKGSTPPAAISTYYAKVRKTIMLYENPEAFCRLLIDGVGRRAAARKRAGKTMMMRLNVFADIPWELFFPEIFDHFRSLQFYDYTKVPARTPPKNYELTFSYSGRNRQACDYALTRGGGVAVVFFAGKQREKRAKERIERVKDIWGYPTINGDLYDARPLDKRVLQKTSPGYEGGHVVSLLFKPPKLVASAGLGLVKRDEVGAFVVDVLYDKESDMFLGPQTPNATMIED